MNFYDIVSKYAEYDTVDKKNRDTSELKYIVSKRRIYVLILAA